MQEQVNRRAIHVADSKHALLARGWNTWDTQSVLHHVLLPEGLCVGLGFALPDKLVWLSKAFFERQQAGRTPGTLLTSMDKTLPLENLIEVRPGIRSYDGAYTSLELNIRGARYRVETVADGGEWVAIVRPLEAAPWPRALTVHAGLLWNRPGYVTWDDERKLTAHLPGREMAVYVEGEPFHDPNLPVMSPYLAVRLDGPVVVSAGRQTDLATAESRVAAAREKVMDLHASYGALREAHEAMHSCLAWNVIYEPKFKRVLCTVNRDWNCKRGGYAVFCWDSFFTSWMIARDNPALGYACMLETFREMIGNAFVSNVVQGTGRRAADRSQPPVAGVCVLGMYRDHPDRESLEAAWPALLAWNRWWHHARQNAVGSLSLGSDPFEPQVGDPAEFVQPNTLAGAALEALDNSPIYDGASFDTQTHLMDQEDVGLNALYVADCRALAEIGRILGHEAETRELTERAAHYGKKLQGLWHEAEGIYLNRRVGDRQWIQRHAPTSFYPLLAGTATPEQAERLVTEYLLNADEYGGAWMIPSVPRHDPAFSEQLYWRGRIWPPVNFLIYLGLKQYGLDAVCKELADKSLDVLVRNWQQHRVVPENFSAIDGTGGLEEHTHPLLTWGGLMGFMAMIEEGRVAPPFQPDD